MRSQAEEKEGWPKGWGRRRGWEDKRRREEDQVAAGRLVYPFLQRWLTEHGCLL